MSRSLLIIDETPGGGHSSKVGRPYQRASPYACGSEKTRSRNCPDLESSDYERAGKVVTLLRAVDKSNLLVSMAF